MTLTLDVPAKAQDSSSQEKRVKAAVALYDAEMMSQGQAAELAGLSLSEFLSSLGHYGVSALQYSAEEAIAEGRIAGTRMKVSQIAEEHIRLGMTPEQVVQAHPHLTLAQVYLALAYYHSHRDVVDLQISQALAYVDQARQEAGPSALAARLRAEGRLPAKDRAA